MIVTNGYGTAGEASSPVRRASTASPVKISGVTDGTSNTAAFSEIAHGLLYKTDGSFNCWNWWTSGNLGDSAMPTSTRSTRRRKRPISLAIDQAGTFVNGASSFHPGGVNVAFVDGSVRFIKESIDYWLRSGDRLSPRCDPRCLCVGRGYRSQDRRLAGPRLGQRRRGHQRRRLLICAGSRLQTATSKRHPAEGDPSGLQRSLDAPGRRPESPCQIQR